MVSRFVQNIINYLSDESYDKDSIYDDIDRCMALHNQQIPIDGLDKLRTEYLKMIKKRQDEAVKFYNAVNTNYPSLVLSNVRMFENYPFRQSRDPKADRDLIVKLNGIDKKFNNTTEQFIFLVLLLLYHSGVKYEESFQDTLYNIVFNYGDVGGPIDVDNMDKAIYVSRIGDKKFPQSLDAAKDLFNKYGDNETTGFFGEYIAIKFIKEHMLNDGDQIVWVSRTLGDGYGFDILVENPITNKYVVYEVKAHQNEDNFNSDNLSYTEDVYRHNSLDKNNNYDYRVIKLLLNRSMGDMIVPVNYIKQMDGCYYDEDGVWRRVTLEKNPVEYMDMTKGRKQ